MAERNLYMRVWVSLVAGALFTALMDDGHSLDSWGAA
jgi:hypothetical protein